MAESDSGPRCRIRMACAAKPSDEHGHPDWVIVLGLPKTCLRNFKSHRYVSGFKKKAFSSIKMLRTLKSESFVRCSLLLVLIRFERVSKRSSNAGGIEKMLVALLGSDDLRNRKPGMR